MEGLMIILGGTGIVAFALAIWSIVGSAFVLWTDTKSGKEWLKNL